MPAGGCNGERLYLAAISSLPYISCFCSMATSLFRASCWHGGGLYARAAAALSGALVSCCVRMRFLLLALACRCLEMKEMESSGGAVGRESGLPLLRLNLAPIYEKRHVA